MINMIIDWAHISVLAGIAAAVASLSYSLYQLAQKAHKSLFGKIEDDNKKLMGDNQKIYELVANIKEWQVELNTKHDAHSEASKEFRQDIKKDINDLRLQTAKQDEDIAAMSTRIEAIERKSFKN